MFCSRSVPIHLLRGVGAVSLLAAAFVLGREQVWLVPPLLVGAVVLLRGCPACWLMGLFETIAVRGSRDAAPEHEGWRTGNPVCADADEDGRGGAALR